MNDTADENKVEEIPAEIPPESEAPTPEPQPQPTENVAPGEPPKKRRGRPPKNPNLIQEGIPHAQASTAPKRTKQKKSEAEIAALGRQLVGIHQMAAMLTGIPECQIQDGEGLLLASGIIAVADQYDLAIDGKTGAALQLFAAAAMVYAPRVMSFNARAKKAREAGAEIVPFTEHPAHGPQTVTGS